MTVKLDIPEVSEKLDCMSEEPRLATAVYEWRAHLHSREGEAR